MKQIDRNKKMAELIQEVPQLGKILADLGIDCADCLASQVDTLLDVARMYQLDIDYLLDQIDQ